MVNTFIYKKFHETSEGQNSSLSKLHQSRIEEIGAVTIESDFTETLTSVVDVEIAAFFWQMEFGSTCTMYIRVVMSRNRSFT